MQFPVIAGLLVLVSLQTHAFTIETGLGVGMRYTDNATLASDNEEDDWIATGSVGASILQDTGPLTVNALGSLRHLDYLNNTYGKQDYLNLDANAAWEQITGSLVWNAQDHYTQTSIDSLGENTPANTQDTNVFSLGPDFVFMLSPRNQLNLGLQFRDYYYQDSDTDNQQYVLSSSWLYQMYPTLSVGVSGSVRQVAYDNDTLNPDYTSSNLGIVLSGSRPRSTYAINLGARHIDRDQFDNQDGFSGSLDWMYTMTGKSSIRAYISSDITDASSGFYNSINDPDTGDYTNQQISGDTIQNNIVRLTYSRNDSTLNSRIWTELRDLDYDVSPDDREVQEYGADLGYQVTAVLTTGLLAEYKKTKQTSIGRTDKDYSLGGQMTYQLSRDLHCDLDLRYRKRDSTQSINEYDEVSIFAGLVYGIGGLRGSSR